MVGMSILDEIEFDLETEFELNVSAAFILMGSRKTTKLFQQVLLFSITHVAVTFCITEGDLQMLTF